MFSFEEKRSQVIMSEEAILKANELVIYQKCRICLQDAKYDLSESLVIFECKELTLLEAFNEFSIIENVIFNSIFLFLLEKYTLLSFSHQFLFFSPYQSDNIYLCEKCTDMLITSYIFCQRIKLSDERFLNIGEITDEPVEEDEDEILSNVVVDLPLPSIETPKKRSPPLSENKKSPKMHKTDNPNETIFKFSIPQFIISSDKTEFINLENSEFIKTMNITKIIPNSIDEYSEFYSFIEEDERNAETIYKCKYCPKAFSTGDHLIVHNRKVHLCQHCLEPFSLTSDLSKHTKEMHQTFDCLICDRSFRSNGNLRQHMRNNHSIFLPAQVTLMPAE